MSSGEFKVFMLNKDGFRTNTGEIYSRARARAVAKKIVAAVKAGDRNWAFLKNYTHVEVHELPDMFGDDDAGFDKPDLKLALVHKSEGKCQKRSTAARSTKQLTR